MISAEGWFILEPGNFHAVLQLGVTFSEKEAYLVVRRRTTRVGQYLNAHLESEIVVFIQQDISEMCTRIVYIILTALNVQVLLALVLERTQVSSMLSSKIQSGFT